MAEKNIRTTITTVNSEVVTGILKKRKTNLLTVKRDVQNIEAEKKNGGDNIEHLNQVVLGSLLEMAFCPHV